MYLEQLRDMVPPPSQNTVSSSSILAFRYSFFLFLKCLLASYLILFRLFTLFLLWFASCNHCILACFLWSKKRKHSSSDRALCCFYSYRPRLSLAEIFIFSLMFSQALFMSSLSLKFSKAGNQFENWICYCVLTSSSFSFLKLNLSTSNFCAACLLTANLSLTSVTTTQWSMSQSAPLKDRRSRVLECHLLCINTWSIAFECCAPLNTQRCKSRWFFSNEVFFFWLLRHTTLCFISSDVSEGSVACILGWLKWFWCDAFSSTSLLRYPLFWWCRQ